MSQITLGQKPEPLQVVLVKGADFRTTLTNQDGDWAVGVGIELRLDDGTVWPATIDGPVATFDVDKVAVDAVSEYTRHVSLFYVEGTADVCWAKGSVVHA